MSEDSGHLNAQSAVPSLSRPSISHDTQVATLADPRAELLELIQVTIEILGDKVVVSDDQVSMYGTGTTLDEALVDYRASLLEYLEWLAANEATLADHLRAHLLWLRARVRLLEPA
jgi:hypothetical protein